jgi:hypothetical protein
VPYVVSVVACEPDFSIVFIVAERVLQSPGEVRAVLRDEVEVSLNIRP